MIRLAASVILGFVLILIQSSIVMQLDHYTSIQFTKPQYILNIWIVNFFLVYSILTQITGWLEKKNLIDSETTDK